MKWIKFGLWKWPHVPARQIDGVGENHVSLLPACFLALSGVLCWTSYTGTRCSNSLLLKIQGRSNFSHRKRLIKAFGKRIRFFLEHLSVWQAFYLYKRICSAPGIQYINYKENNNFSPKHHPLIYLFISQVICKCFSELILSAIA